MREKKKYYIKLFHTLHGYQLIYYKVMEINVNRILSILEAGKWRGIFLLFLGHVDFDFILNI